MEVLHLGESAVGKVRKYERSNTKAKLRSFHREDEYMS